MKRNTLIAVTGFVLGGIVVATGVVAAPAAPKDHKRLDRTACKRELAWAGLPAHDNLAQPGREPSAVLLLAVDRRIAGCRVLTPANARAGFLPEPEPGQSPARLRPATGG